MFSLPKIIENFYGENLYTFTNQTCSCKEDLIYETPHSNPRRIFKLFPEKNNTVRFAYQAKKGLVRLDSNGSTIQENILGTFIGLSTASRTKREKFLSDNGFIFPLAVEEFNPIDEEAFLSIIQRLKLTVDLMTALSSNKKDYKEILTLTLNLLFLEQTKIKVADYSYCSCKHPFSNIIEKADKMTLNGNNQRVARAGGEYFSITDTIVGTHYQFKISDYNDIMSSQGYSNNHLQWKITNLYVCYNGNTDERNVIDLLFHFFHDTEDVFNSYENVEPAILSFAQNIVGEEINHNLSGIHPEYNSMTMEPSWRVDSLMSALYFSLFYLRPKMELYRPCGNPRCNNYFLVKSTSSKTKYCSTKCANNVTQSRYRQKRGLINKKCSL